MAGKIIIQWKTGHPHVHLRHLVTNIRMKLTPYNNFVNLFSSFEFLNILQHCINQNRILLNCHLEMDIGMV